VEYGDATLSFTYLKNGLLETAVNAIGTVSNGYNFANRLVASSGAVVSGGVSYSYYPAGQVSNVTSVAGTTAYAIDAASRLDMLQAPEGYYTNTYNPYNGLIAETICTNTGVSVAYDYDVMDRITGMIWKDASSNVLRSFSYSYDAAGMITSVEAADGSSVLYSYDSLDRLTGETKLDAKGETACDAEYSYDLVGNRTAKTISGFTVAYSVTTNSNRLAAWTVTPPFAGAAAIVDVAGHSSETIGTDPRFGRRSISNLVARTPEIDGTNFWLRNFVVGSGGQSVVAAISDEAGNVGYATNTITVKAVTNATYGYNSAGCITNITYTGANYGWTNTIAWNQQYQITSLTTNGTTAETFAYDALGRRVKRVADGVTNWFVHDGIHVCAEVDDNGNLQKSYTWGPGVDNLLAYTDHTTTNTYYMITDHLGTVHAVVNSCGSVVESYKYDAWGRVLGVYDGDGKPLEKTAIGNNYLWQGRWYSWNTGLYYFRARWYDPITGRWLSKDPIGISGGLNQYVFADNSAVNRRDPPGLEAGLGGNVCASLGLPDPDFSPETYAVIGAGLTGAFEGNAAFWDGVIPFADPFESLYDPTDKSLKVSKGIGIVTREAEIYLAFRGLKNAILAHNIKNWAQASWGRQALARAILFPQLFKEMVRAGDIAAWAPMVLSAGSIASKIDTVTEFVQMYQSGRGRDIYRQDENCR